ncbi:hypothetical protein K5X82_18395 [Halosquirtibacter xylanolyticus]|uniref:hypothetical protein n=1 Tax=Halosquirtibacter xylanolyticus TaxID=3374599 RepID=UPI0037479FA6|nr:hypothetical protein K5X82_18395 [Prolixibacteraceae bacterium]
MAGRKYFTNATPYTLWVTLIIRECADPRHTAGTKDFSLNSGQSLWVEYGNNINIFLNGIQITAVLDGSIVSQQYIVIQRSSKLDNMLNMRNGVTFTYNAGTNSFGINTKQV